MDLTELRAYHEATWSKDSDPLLHSTWRMYPNRPGSSDLARKLNHYAADVRAKNPEKFGFFASLPSLLDKEAAQAEITYPLDSLKVDGIVIFTRYGHENSYLGNPDVEPIWRELHQRRAVVFVHPTHPVDVIKINPKMPEPMIGYPHETTRAAMNIIMMGTRRKYPDQGLATACGWTLPYLVSQLATPMLKVPDFATYHMVGTTHEKTM